MSEGAIQVNGASMEQMSCGDVLPWYHSQGGEVGSK